MVTLLAYHEMPTNPIPDARALYFDTQPIDGKLGQAADFEALCAADFMGGRLVVKQMLYDSLAGHAHNRQTSHRKRFSPFKRAEDNANRTVANVILHSMGVHYETTARLCGVHRNVATQDRRHFREFMQADSDIAALHAAFKGKYLAVDTPIELDLRHHTSREIEMLGWLAAGLSIRQATMQNQPESQGALLEAELNLNRTLASHGWVKLGVNTETSASLLLHLAQNSTATDTVNSSV